MSVDLDVTVGSVNCKLVGLERPRPFSVDIK